MSSVMCSSSMTGIPPSARGPPAARGRWGRSLDRAPGYEVDDLWIA